MTSIDPTRLTEIFKTLAASRSQRVSRKLSAESNDTPIKETSSHGGQRDKNKLREQLKSRLTKLKQESTSFEDEAPLVTINEVLLWEFGDNILDHPDFKYIAETVCDTIDTNPSLNNSMKSLIRELLR